MACEYYVPILKWKKGEQEALLNLAHETKTKTLPLIEIPFSKKSMEEIYTDIENTWGDRDFYLYLMPSWYNNEEDYENWEELYQAHKTNVSVFHNLNAIPVFDLSDKDILERWHNEKKGRIAIRIRDVEFECIETELNPIFEETSLKREDVDLILDLQRVEQQLSAKKALLKGAFSDIKDTYAFHSVIIASGSFPKELPNVEAYEPEALPRLEKEIHALAGELAKKYQFQYKYADYGPFDIELFEFVVGMIPNFKIRYTIDGHYLYIKGLSLKKGGLDIDEIRKACKVLKDTTFFAGENFSWGDEQISNILNGTSQKGGNLTKWVSFTMNHHITMMTNSI